MMGVSGARTHSHYTEPPLHLTFRKAVRHRARPCGVGGWKPKGETRKGGLGHQLNECAVSSSIMNHNFTFLTFLCGVHYHRLKIMHLRLASVKKTLL